VTRALTTCARLLLGAFGHHPETHGALCLRLGLEAADDDSVQAEGDVLVVAVAHDDRRGEVGERRAYGLSFRLALGLTAREGLSVHGELARALVLHADLLGRRTTAVRPIVGSRPARAGW